MFASMARSKTLWFSFGVTVFGVLEAQYSLISHYLPDEHRGLGLVLIGLASAALRFATTQPVSQK